MVPTRFVLACALGLPACIREEDVLEPPSKPPWAGVVETAPAVAATTTQGRGRRAYDTATETTLAGVVRSIERTADSDTMHVRLGVGDETVAVHLGPREYLEEIGLEPHVDERLTVVGARGPGFLIARQVQRDNRSWTLRDAAGTPVWGARIRTS